jgi:hypothetical protein
MRAIRMSLILFKSANLHFGELGLMICIISDLSIDKKKKKKRRKKKKKNC